ncbi:hypothetical protein BASA50_007006 [Batrachochytrium salamandrivorans]|uniref:Uncharacterized protein n=1 Tax=Batrachochytrium salamandrivorans TaxID=1357716 RepID=A0ABQ8F8C6_9FUNG|nr:hypothetical protein BASA50_007006 [Batrachochytrium salamandrivorans]
MTDVSVSAFPPTSLPNLTATVLATQPPNQTSFISTTGNNSSSPNHHLISSSPIPSNNVFYTHPPGIIQNLPAKTFALGNSDAFFQAIVNPSLGSACVPDHLSSMPSTSLLHLPNRGYPHLNVSPMISPPLSAAMRTILISPPLGINSPILQPTSDGDVMDISKMMPTQADEAQTESFRGLEEAQTTAAVSSDNVDGDGFLDFPPLPHVPIKTTTANTTTTPPLVRRVLTIKPSAASLSTSASSNIAADLINVVSTDTASSMPPVNLGSFIERSTTKQPSVKKKKASEQSMATASLTSPSKHTDSSLRDSRKSSTTIAGLIANDTAISSVSTAEVPATLESHIVPTEVPAILGRKKKKPKVQLPKEKHRKTPLQDSILIESSVLDNAPIMTIPKGETVECSDAASSNAELAVAPLCVPKVPLMDRLFNCMVGAADMSPLPRSDVAEDYSYIARVVDKVNGLKKTFQFDITPTSTALEGSVPVPVLVPGVEAEAGQYTAKLEDFFDHVGNAASLLCSGIQAKVLHLRALEKSTIDESVSSSALQKLTKSQRRKMRKAVSASVVTYELSDADSKSLKALTLPIASVFGLADDAGSSNWTSNDWLSRVLTLQDSLERVWKTMLSIHRLRSGGEKPPPRALLPVVDFLLFPILFPELDLEGQSGNAGTECWIDERCIDASQSIQLSMADLGYFTLVISACFLTLELQKEVATAACPGALSADLISAVADTRSIEDLVSDASVLAVLQPQVTQNCPPYDGTTYTQDTIRSGKPADSSIPPKEKPVDPMFNVVDDGGVSMEFKDDTQYHVHASSVELPPLYPISDDSMQPLLRIVRNLVNEGEAMAEYFEDKLYEDIPDSDDTSALLQRHKYQRIRKILCRGKMPSKDRMHRLLRQYAIGSMSSEVKKNSANSTNDSYSQLSRATKQSTLHGAYPNSQSIRTYTLDKTLDYFGQSDQRPGSHEKINFGRFENNDGGFDAAWRELFGAGVDNVPLEKLSKDQQKLIIRAITAQFPNPGQLFSELLSHSQFPDMQTAEEQALLDEYVMQLVFSGEVHVQPAASHSHVPLECNDTQIGVAENQPLESTLSPFDHDTPSCLVSAAMGTSGVVESKQSVESDRHQQTFRNGDASFPTINIQLLPIDNYANLTLNDRICQLQYDLEISQREEQHLETLLVDVVTRNMACRADLCVQLGYKDIENFPRVFHDVDLDERQWRSDKESESDEEDDVDQVNDDQSES